MFPLQVLGLVTSLNLGEQITVVLVLGFVVLYVYRGKKVAGTVVAIASTGWIIFASIAVALVTMILLGWVDPNPSQFTGDIAKYGSALFDFLVGAPMDVLKAGIRAALDAL